MPICSCLSVPEDLAQYQSLNGHHFTLYPATLRSWNQFLPLTGGETEAQRGLMLPQGEGAGAPEAVSALFCCNVLTFLELAFRAVVLKCWVHEHDQGAGSQGDGRAIEADVQGGERHLCMVFPGPWASMVVWSHLENQ